MNTIINAIVPIGSVLIGAGLTYWLNVRARRKNYVEDQFNVAIAAVATADASRSYLKRLARPDNMSEHAFQGVLAEIARAAIENNMRQTGLAREAIARVAQYEPQLKRFYKDAQALVENSDAALEILIRARDRLK